MSVGGGKKAGGFAPPAHAISTKNKHLLTFLNANPRFHGGSFGVYRHTSHEAFEM
jgi:hypothetical protein